MWSVYKTTNTQDGGGGGGGAEGRRPEGNLLVK